MTTFKFSLFGEILTISTAPVPIYLLKSEWQEYALKCVKMAYPDTPITQNTHKTPITNNFITIKTNF